MTNGGSNKSETKGKTYSTSPPRRSEFDVGKLNAIECEYVQVYV